MAASVLLFACGAYAMSLTIPFWTIAWVHALLVVIRQVPITISGLGVREGILIATLGPYGVEPERAFALGLLLFSNQVLFALVGAAYHFLLACGWAQWATRQ